MAKLTREEVIARVKAGKSLAGEDLSELDLSKADLHEADLSGANLSKADLYKANLIEANLNRANLSGASLSGADLIEANLIEANLSGANLSKADLSGANLSGANLIKTNIRECVLCSANLEDANLSGTDLTGANIWNIATANWKINGVKCEYVYNCKNYWNKEEKENTRRDFAPGKFEQIYKEFPKLELIFKEGFSHLDHRVLLTIIDHIKQALSDLEIRKFERVSDTTTVTLTAKTNETLKKIAIKELPKIYAEMMAGFTEIKSHLTHQSPQLPSSLPEQWLAQIKEIFEQAVHPPDEVVCENKSINFKKKFEQAGKWIGKKGLKISEETFYRFLAELGIIFAKGFLPPH